MSLHKNIAVLITISFAISIAATELYLPSLPQIATFFNTSKEMVQLSVSAHFFGNLLLTLIVGVLSDYYGRHPIMLAGMLIYILGVLSCICAPSIWFFIFGRFIQGIGSKSEEH